MVRKVVAYELLSLDGVAEQPDEFVTDFDDVMQRKSRPRHRHPGHRAPRAPDLRRLGRVLADK